MSKNLTVTTGVTPASTDIMPVSTTVISVSSDVMPVSTDVVVESESSTERQTVISTIKFENKVYIVFSKWDVKKIVQFCRSYGDVYWSRLVFDKEGNETDRTLLIMPDETYDGLVHDGYESTDRKRTGINKKPSGFRIAPYVLREGQEHTDAPTLFVPAPKEHRGSSLIAESVVNAKLTTLADCGIIPQKSWSAEAPTHSREAGNVKSGIFITFANTVERGRIAMTRILINDSYWPSLGEEASSVFRCYWARDRTENKDRPTQSRATEGGAFVPRKDAGNLSVAAREKLQEERRLLRLTKLLEKAVPSETTVIVKGKKVIASQPSARK